jgi:hypothetical protein
MTQSQQLIIQQIQKDFGEIVQENPLKLNVNCLNQLKLEINSVRIRKNNRYLINYEIHHGLKYGNYIFRDMISTSSLDFLKKFFYNKTLIDPEDAHDNLSIQKMIKTASDKAKKKILFRNIFSILMFWQWSKLRHWSHILSVHRMGDCHLIWHEQKKLLKQQYNISWKSYQDLHPGARID